MKKLLTSLAAVLGLALVALAAGSVRWRPARPVAPPRLEAVARGRGQLLAGAAAVALAPAPPVPVAGFPRLRWTEEGRRDPVAARALVLREHGCTVALVSMEIVLVPGALQQAVADSVRDLELDRLIVAATHTHAGPGGYWRNPLGERLATGPYSEATFDSIARAAGDAVRRATTALEPAYLSVARGEVTALARNRRGGVVDGRLVSARLVGRTGKPLAEVVLYPSHGTLLGPANRLVSGDWPGALMRSQPEPVLFFQGAVGDQAPLLPPDGGPTGAAGERGDPELYARALRKKIAELEYSAPDPRPELSVATSTVALPDLVPGAIPPLLRRVAANVFYDSLPSRAHVSAVRLGALTLVAVPGEPVAAVGQRWRDAAGPGGEILSLAGDYLGYFETHERMAEGSGETVHTYYGPELAGRLTAGVQLSVEALREESGATAPDPAAQMRSAPLPAPSGAVRGELERQAPVEPPSDAAGPRVGRTSVAPARPPVTGTERRAGDHTR